MEPNTSVPRAPVMNTGALEGPRKLLSSAWSLYKTNWKTLMYIVVAPSIISAIGQILAVAKNPILAIVAFLIFMVGVVYSAAMLPAAVNAIHRLSTESGANLMWKTQYKFGFSLFWSVVFLAILQLIIALGAYALFILPGIIISGYFCMYIFALVIDGKKGFSALTESYSLVKGRWWGVFGRFLYFVLVYIGVGIIVGIIGLGLDFILGFNSKSTGASVVSIVMNLVLVATVAPLALVYAYKLYASLKQSRIADVSTVGFRKWLVAFLVIGIMAAIILPIIVVPIMISAINNYKEQFRNLPPPYGYTSVNPGNGMNGSDYFPNGQYPGANNAPNTQ